MPRPFFAPVRAAASTFSSILQTFRIQGLGGVSWFPIIIFLFALVFAFLAATPILSPFVYPLF